ARALAAARGDRTSKRYPREILESFMGPPRHPSSEPNHLQVEPRPLAGQAREIDTGSDLLARVRDTIPLHEMPTRRLTALQQHTHSPPRNIEDLEPHVGG